MYSSIKLQESGISTRSSVDVVKVKILALTRLRNDAEIVMQNLSVDRYIYFISVNKIAT